MEKEIHSGLCGENMTYRLEDNTLYIEGQGEIAPYVFFEGDFERVVIAEGCTEIGEYAFGYCRAVKKVELPKSLKKIGAGAFLLCRNLWLLVSDNVTSIGRDAFEGVECIRGDEAVCNLENGVLHVHCSGKIGYLPRYDVKEVVIHEGCTGIGNQVFQNWEGLETVCTPTSLLDIAYDAFVGCERVQLKMQNAAVLWRKGLRMELEGVQSFHTDYKLQYEIEGDTLYVGNFEEESSYILQRNYEGLYDMNWMEPDTWDRYEKHPWPIRIHKTIRKIVIAPGCKIIGECIFQGFKYVETIEIPQGVEEIELYAFACCEKLNTLVVPDTVTKIGTDAFKYVPHIIYHGPAQSDNNWGAKSRN